jgi:hypothetical protein
MGLKDWMIRGYKLMSRIYVEFFPSASYVYIGQFRWISALVLTKNELLPSSSVLVVK